MQRRKRNFKDKKMMISNQKDLKYTNTIQNENPAFSAGGSFKTNVLPWKWISDIIPRSVDWPGSQIRMVVQMFMVAIRPKPRYVKKCVLLTIHVFWCQTSGCWVHNMKPWHWFNFMMAVIFLEFHPETRKKWDDHSVIIFQSPSWEGHVENIFYKPLSHSPRQEGRVYKPKVNWGEKNYLYRRHVQPDCRDWNREIVTHGDFEDALTSVFLEGCT